MQKSQFTDEQIVAILQQAEKGDKSISEVCRQHNIAENSFYRWRILSLAQSLWRHEHKRSGTRP